MMLPCDRCLLVCAVTVGVLLGSVQGWLPKGIGMLPYNVVRPALTLGSMSTDPSSSPFPSDDFGVPLVAIGDSELVGSVAQYMYPLQETLRSNTVALTTASHGEPPIGGSSVVALSNGTLLYMNMCDVASGNSSRGNATISVFGGVNHTELWPMWSSGRVAVVNATCVRAWLPLAQVNSTVLLEREVVLIVGGVAITTLQKEAHLMLSMWDPTSLEWYDDVEISGPHRTLLGGAWVLQPMATVASNGMLLIGGGIAQPANMQWADAALSRFVCSAAITLTQLNASLPLLHYSVAVYHLPQLPQEILLVPTNDYAGAYAMSLFENSLYVGLVTHGQPGTVSRLELSELSLPVVNISGNEWMTVTLDGDLFPLMGATAVFIPLPHEGTVLALFAVGGVPVSNERPPSISYVVVDASFVPAWVEVPYQPTSGVLSFDEDVTASTVNITTTFELIAAGAFGLLGLGTSSFCSGIIGTPINYVGSTTAVLTANFDAAECSDRQLWGRPLYLCFSNNVSVLWEGIDGAVVSTLLFTAISPLEPLQFPSAPIYTPPSSPSLLDKIRSFFKNHWLYVTVGVLALVTLIATIVSVRTLRRKGGLRRGLSQIFHEASPLLTSGDDQSRDGAGAIGRYDPLKIATNSHSSRYATIAPLPSLDGPESDVTFLVQRKSDRAMLVMKYIPCEGDIERLLSIREFEALNILQGHPNVVQYVDMFMNYAFSQHRMGRSHDPQGMVGDVMDQTDGSLNTTTAYVPLASTLSEQDVGSTPGSLGAMATPSSSLLTPKLAANRVSRLSLPPAEASLSAKDAVVNNRYVCLVMEYMPQGNIASWLMKRSERQMPFAKRARRAIAVEDLPPANEQLILSVALQVNSLLKYMHYDSEVTLAHKGLKPENILVSGPVSTTGTYIPVAVSDFGFSVLGHFTPPSRMVQRRRDSNELDRASESGASRSSMSQPMDTSGYLQSPKCDMWCFGCVLFSLCTFRFGDRFPYLAELLSAQGDASVYVSIQNEMRERGYSRELVSLTISLLHMDEKLRPSSDAVSRQFSRLPDGSLSLAVPSVMNRQKR